MTLYLVKSRLIEKRLCLCDSCRVKPLTTIEFALDIECEDIRRIPEIAEQSARDTRHWTIPISEIPYMGDADFELISVKEIF